MFSYHTVQQKATVARCKEVTLSDKIQFGKIETKESAIWFLLAADNFGKYALFYKGFESINLDF